MFWNCFICNEFYYLSLWWYYKSNIIFCPNNQIEFYIVFDKKKSVCALTYINREFKM